METHTELLLKQLKNSYQSNVTYRFEKGNYINNTVRQLQSTLSESKYIPSQRQAFYFLVWCFTKLILPREIASYIALEIGLILTPIGFRCLSHYNKNNPYQTHSHFFLYEREVKVIVHKFKYNIMNLIIIPEQIMIESFWIVNFKTLNGQRITEYHWTIPIYAEQSSPVDVKIRLSWTEPEFTRKKIFI